MNVRLDYRHDRSIPEAMVDDLAQIDGFELSKADSDLIEAGRDWWPITMTWTRDGDQPAIPDVVIRPHDTKSVAEVLAVADKYRVPVTPFAGRSGVCGGSLPVQGGISLDMRRLDKIVSIDDTNLMVHAEAGVYGPHLESALNEQGLTVGHFPQSFDIATVGGWIACRGAGQFSNRYGKIEDIVKGIEVVLADGTIVTTNAQPASATGPDLKAIFVGSEGTLGVITSAWLQVWPLAEERGMVAFSFESFADTIEICRRLARKDALPAVLRTYDAWDSALHFGFDDERCALIAIAEGDASQVDREIVLLTEEVAAFGDSGRIEDEQLCTKWLESRNDVSALDTVIDHGMVVDTIEIAAPWSRLSTIYDEVRSSILGVEGSVTAIAHASHAYLSGACLYFTFAGMPGETAEEKDGYYKQCWEVTMQAVHDNGGTISHHHGIGVNRARFLPQELGNGMDVLRRMKRALDPNAILNPGKLALDPGDIWR